ncbi:NUDIX domain-containing protein [Flaviaesturariibacter aridisoli]|uniref:GDP-mannose pyrophosphatase n=1 Tax=Flaviaesturariibacter aridisoli TaxID=2545761 RepID=A0A4V2WN91_9BACT|nr:NUDIX domain-containing protein [Flaviaesturariibacter aridisoli]TCZ74592.1 NUDIX domain-containing protein [Flaviaesturariibacter aridisoli]
MKERIRNISTEVLSKGWSTLSTISFDYRRRDGSWERQQREAYDHGNGAAILLYHPGKGTVLLTRQFRMVTYLYGNPEGMLWEVPAGLLDEEHPDEGIRRETEEETGYRPGAIRPLFSAYMSPGSLTELVHFYAAEYDDTMKTAEGGGVAHEQEEIEVVELPFAKALKMINSGEIRDGKTIMLLQWAALNGVMSNE